MKKIFVRILAVVALTITAAVQTMAQQSFAYQAVIRDSDGNLVTSGEVGLRFTLMNGGKDYYVETQTAEPNKYGNISVMVGKGKADKGSMADVPWNTLDVTMKVEVKPAGAKEFFELGQTKINPAPYAMYAAQGGGAATVSSAVKDGEPLFQVNDRNGRPVFAVTNDGIVVYVDEQDDGKMRRSGFLVTGREATKGEPAKEYFSVTSDGTTVYTDDSDQSGKMRRSGFLVTGREATKDGSSADYLSVDGTGTTVYVDADSNGDDKMRRSGFLVTGREATKDGYQEDMFRIDGSQTTVYVDEDDSNGKMRRSGFLVTGREATKADRDQYLAVTSEKVDIKTTAFTVVERNESLGTVQSMIAVNTGNDGQTQVVVHTDIAMEGESLAVVRSDEKDNYTLEVADSAWIAVSAENGLGAFLAEYPDYTQMIAIYGEGQYTPVVEEMIEMRHGNESYQMPVHYIMFNSSGEPTTLAKNASAVVFWPDTTCCIIRALEPMDQTIAFGFADPENPDGGFVKITAQINAKTGLPYNVPQGDFDGGRVEAYGDICFGSKVKLEAIPEKGKILGGWQITAGGDESAYTVSFGKEFTLNMFFEMQGNVTPFFTDPVLYVYSDPAVNSDLGASSMNTGLTKDDPLNSISMAVAMMYSINSPDADWTIKVMDKVNYTTSGSIAISDRVLAVEPLQMERIPAKSIRLTGFYGVDKNGVCHDSICGKGYDSGMAELKGTALTINTEVPVTIDSLKITSGDKSDGNGGGISILQGNVTLGPGAVVSGNTAKNGGGVYVSSGTLTLNGGTISGNTASEYGGGVYVGGKFDMASGSISGNQANWGGGVMATATGGAEFTMTGGEIAGNSAAKGSGVYEGTCTFTMSGDARVNAGNDVYLASGQKITIGGAFSGSDIVATITPTNYNTALANPVLGGESELVESLCGRFAVTPGRTQSDGDLKYWRVGSDGKLQELIGTKSVPDAVGDIVFTDGSAVPYSEDLTLTQGQKNSAVAVIFDAENKKGVALGQSSDQTRWCAETTLSGYGDVPGACGQDNGWDNTNAIYELSDFEMNSGNYPPFEYAKGYTAGGYTDWYIPAIHELQAIQSNNAILNQAINKVGGTSITLAQYTYYWSSSQDERGGNNSNYAYYVRFDNYAVVSTTKVGDAMYRQVAYSRCVRQFGGNNNSSKLTTYYVAPNATNGGIGNDSNNGLSGNAPFATIGKAISMMTEAKNYLVVICGGVKGNQTIENIPDGSTLTIMGNRNNEADALNADNSGTVLEIKTSVPVAIKNLKITQGGACGIKMEGNADVTLGAGALVVSNDAGQDGLGGGVYIAGGKLTMLSGSEVSSNKAMISSGGGIYIAEGATFDMKGGKIESNQAGYFGQSVYVGGTFNMSGGTIESNPSYYDGGDVRVNRNAVFNIKGTAKIDNNDYVLLDSYSDEYATINIAGELEGTGRVAIIKPLNYDDDIPLLTSSVAGYLPTDRFAVEMNDGIVWNITSDGKLKGDFTKGKGTMKSLKGVFTVSSDGKKVQFSSGNLNYYRAQPKRWEFAAHQYDAIRYDNVVYPAPSYRASFNDNIDLFGYGTSGYNSRTPDLNAISNDTYWSNNLTGDGGANYDWGVKITEDYNTTEQWRTLTQTEWTYLLARRTNAKQLYGLATVAGVSGLILLPDNWSSDGMPAFTSGTTGGYDNNTYSSEQWAQMEENGAVFLPITGYRSGTMSNGEVVMSVEDYYYAGYYWSATAGKCLHFYTSSTKNECKVDDGSRANGYAVRLVHDYEETFFGTKAPGSNLEVGDIVFSDGSAMPYSEGLTLDESQKEAAIAVIFYVGTDGDALGKRTLGIGKYNSTADGSNNTYDWAKEGALGNDPSEVNSKFTDILSYQVFEEPASGQYASFYGDYLTGDLNGSDNWEKVKGIDVNYSGNYPGFEWVDDYANRYNLPENYKDGWYLPSAAELYTLWMNLYGDDKNKLINTILTTIGGTKLKDEAENGEYVYDYLTSNRTYEDDESISLTIGFDTGATCSQGLKTVDGYVCAIREF